MTDIDLSAAEEIAALAEQFTPLGAWVAAAVCAGRDVDPTAFDAPAPRNGVVTEDHLAAFAETAATFCARCPVQRECLLDAIDNDMTGLRGGALITTRAAGFRYHPLTAERADARTAA